MKPVPGLWLLLVGAALLSAIAAPGPGHAKDMMSTCAGEIDRHCSGVSKGDGRITACLISTGDKLGAACSAAVQTTATKSSRSMLVPPGVRKMLNAGQAVPVPVTCSGDVSRVCQGIGPGENLQLACLYSRSDKISKTCAADMRKALR